MAGLMQWRGEAQKQQTLSKRRHGSFSAWLLVLSIGFGLLALRCWLQRGDARELSSQPKKSNAALAHFARARESAKSSGEDAAASQSATVRDVAVLEAVPVEAKEGNKWAVKNFYEYQALRVGLRVLNKAVLAGKVKVPEQKPELAAKWTRAMRAKELEALALGKKELQSLQKSEVAMMQPDMTCMPLPLLLQLKNRYLDVRQDAFGDSHEAFFDKMDAVLFPHLGNWALQGIAVEEAAGSPMSPELAGRFGREIPVLLAVASGISGQQFIVWWLSESQRVYFDADRFASQDAFPSAGVLDWVDSGRNDVGDKLKKLKKMEWAIRLATAEGEVYSSDERRKRSGSLAQPKLSVHMIASTRASLRAVEPGGHK